MASLRSMAVLRAAACRPALSLRQPALARFQSGSSTHERGQPGLASTSEPPHGSHSESAMIRQEGAAEGQPRHSPDYNVATDYRTSNFSPVPTRVMDGSEPGVDTPAAVLSGAPVELQARTVRIYKPAKTATQSGDWHSHHWRMDWDPLSKGHRWENPLMGWQSSADFMQGTHLNFESKDDAIRFANKQGYEYFVQEPNERRIIPKAYADQFVHSPKKLKQVRTK
ncbi:NADH-ubiquinone oxidoreductase 21 kDa subunit, mitochondrial [Lecanosticta acicola]|uniref:NADH dehydrogenase [ubiquinone] iron-sulfur protein 4, mitochondrial n=1 Tax=Lecanosticta acicola TaxID=111012 RepID=A0AAI8Z9C7_9PEZI|nr:NADH-ubiquinone oxidoreductase 21 kDa subunit, mitochondrial [Lecanosticta acicola]